jgi:hypothetical protein
MEVLEDVKDKFEKENKDPRNIIPLLWDDTNLMPSISSSTHIH